MKRLAILATLCATCPAWASPPDEPQQAAQSLVERELVAPLAAKEAHRSRFTRVALVPLRRRVRIVDGAPLHDAHGAAFVRYAVDARRGFGGDDGDESRWAKSTLTGCVYLDAHQVFVRRGDRHYPAALLLGVAAPVAEAATCVPVDVAKK